MLGILEALDNLDNPVLEASNSIHKCLSKVTRVSSNSLNGSRLLSKFHRDLRRDLPQWRLVIRWLRNLI
jgi:hypothetical protein